jgi:hypothetical protein
LEKKEKKEGKKMKKERKKDERKKRAEVGVLHELISRAFNPPPLEGH